jgi:hypothetical protein
MPAVRAVGLNPAAGIIAHRAQCGPIPRRGKAESGGADARRLLLVICREAGSMGA